MNKQTQKIAQKVREIRRARRWTQAELAKLLGLSQNRLSEIEAGKGSFTAENLITILKTFNVPIDDFVDDASSGESGTQNALSRLGATDLAENDRVLPSQSLNYVFNVIREVVVAGDSPRHLTALAPVIVNHASPALLNRLRLQFFDLQLIHRWGWVLENTQEAVQRELRAGRLSSEWEEKYKRADHIIGNFLRFSHFMVHPIPKDFIDTLDTPTPSQKSLVKLRASSSPLSRKWHIASRIKTEDFAAALRNSWELR